MRGKRHRFLADLQTAASDEEAIDLIAGALGLLAGPVGWLAVGAGAAEVAGLMAALIRKLVKVAPRALIAYLIVLVGVLSSVASDAGYLILIPLGAAAFLAVGRHPIAGW